MFYSPTIILDRNPQLAKIWKPRDIGYLLHLKLVNGRRIAHTNSCEVLEVDVLKVFELTQKK